MKNHIIVLKSLINCYVKSNPCAKKIGAHILADFSEVGPGQLKFLHEYAMESGIFDEVSWVSSTD